MPNANTPKLSEWLEEFKKHQDKIDENSILIGHSLGCPFLLNVMQLLPINPKKIFLVAGFTGKLAARPEYNTMVKDIADREFDWEQLRNNAEWVLLNSDNDPWITVDQAMQLGLNLGVEVNMLHKEHFNDRTFEELWDLIQKYSGYAA